MKSSMLQRIGWVLLTFCIPLYAHSQTKPVKKEAAGSISGRVTIKGKGAPGIVVGLRATERFNRQTSIYKATTDQEGNYRIINVASGTYHVIPYAPIFVISGDRGGKTLLIASGETVEGVDFTLNRGGVITGKVTDSDGRPLIEEQITLLPVEGNTQSYMPQGSSTDDRGIYRIFGIPQGRYRVAMGQSDDNFQVRGPRRSLYRQTFHPAATEAPKATVIDVSEGSEATNVDIIVGRAVATHTASGQIVDGATGKPLPNVQYGVQTISEHSSYRNSAVSPAMKTDSRGEFKVEHLRTGKYSIFIAPQANEEITADPVQFELIDQDVTGLLLKTSPGASLSGAVLLEGTNDRSLFARLSQMLVHVQGIGDWSQPVPIRPDGSFRIGGLRAGTAQFSLNSPYGTQPRGFTLIRVERDGIAQPHGVEIKDAEQVTGVRLVVGYGNGTIRGLVRFENGELPAMARFSVWLTQVSNPTSSQHFPSPNIDSRGRFLIEGLPPGNYEVNAAVYVPESRNAPPRGKQQVNVADGVVTEVTITLQQNP